jgi:hypothetical protein
LLAVIILYSIFQSYPLILLAVSLYLAATVLKNNEGVALSWLFLASAGIFGLPYGKYQLTEIASIASVCLFASIIDLTNRSLISGSGLTSEQLFEVATISKSIILAASITMILALMVSITSVYIRANAIILSNPVVGILLFGSLMIALVLIALSEASVRKTKNSSSSG